MLPERETHKLLHDLCVRLGFCLPPEAQKQLKENPPADVRFFTDAVFDAEDLDPGFSDRHLYRQVRDMVAAAYRRSGDPGA